MKLIAIILGLLVVVAAGLIVFFGDQRTRTIYLAPEASDGWKTPAPIQPSKIPHKTESACQVMQLYPGQCWIFPWSFPAPSRLEYQDGDVRILVMATDLLDPDHSRTGVGPGFSQLALDGKILLQLSVWRKRPDIKITLKNARIYCSDSSGSFKQKELSYLRYTMIRALPAGAMQMPNIPGFQMGALLVNADPSKTSGCILTLKDAVGSNKPVPDLSLRAVPVAYYRLII